MAKNTLKKYLPLILITALAAFYRYWQIDVLPAGLYPDEAANGLDINSILNGDLQPFYERGNGREALFFYLLLPAVLMFGRTPFAHHLTSATVGVAVVVMTYLMVKRWFGARTALISGILAAVSSWHVTMSRTAFRANLTPLFITLFLYFITRFFQSNSKREYWCSAILSGIFFGLGFYTYISYRMMVPFVGLTLVLLLIYDSRNSPRFALFKKYLKGLIAWAVAGLVTLVPLVWYFIQNPSALAARTGHVSIFSKDLNHGDIFGTFLDVVGKTFLGFVTDGDMNWRHNVSGFPFMSFLIAPFFIAGLILIISQTVIFILRILRKVEPMEHQINLHRLPFYAIGTIFAVMLVPEVLTAEGIPHGLRLAGVLPLVFIIPALFIEEIYKGMSHIGANINRHNLKWLNIVFTVLLFAEVVYGGFLYFNIAAKSPDYYRFFRGDLTVVSNYLNERKNKDKTYLVLEHFWDQTTQYLTTANNMPYKGIDPGSFWNGPAGARVQFPETENKQRVTGVVFVKGDQVVFAQDTQDTSQALNRYPGTFKLVKEEKNKFGETIMAVYEKQ